MQAIHCGLRARSGAAAAAMKPNVYDAIENGVAATTFPFRRAVMEKGCTIAVIAFGAQLECDHEVAQATRQFGLKGVS